MERLNLKDKKLIYELDFNSRQSAAKLGRKIALSKQGVSLKINNLVKKGIIKSFVTVLNTSLLGRISFRIYFKLTNISPEEEEVFKKYLVANKDIPWVVGCEGLWDYIIVVFSQNFDDFQKFNVELNNQFGKFINKKNIAIITEANHFRSGYLIGKKKNMSPLVYAGQPKEKIKFDSKDEEIMNLLSKNSRISLIDLSSKIKLNAKTISYRIEKLKKLNIIEGYTITVDYTKIGFERYKLFIQTKNLNEKMEKKFLESMRAFPYVLYYSKSIGSSDIELELIVKDSLHLREILSYIRKNFGNLIKNYETMKIYEEFKLDFFPFSPS